MTFAIRDKSADSIENNSNGGSRRLQNGRLNILYTTQLFFSGNAHCGENGRRANEKWKPKKIERHTVVDEEGYEVRDT